MKVKVKRSVHQVVLAFLSDNRSDLGLGLFHGLYSN